MDSFWGCSRSEERLPRQRSNGKFTAAVVGVGLLVKGCCCPQGGQGHSGPPGDKGIAGEPVSASSGGNLRDDCEDAPL